MPDDEDTMMADQYPLRWDPDLIRHLGTCPQCGGRTRLIAYDDGDDRWDECLECDDCDWARWL